MPSPSPRAQDDWLERLFWPLFGACLAAAAALALAYRWLPLHDFPDHCAIASVVSHLGEPEWRYGEYYRAARLPPYLTFQWLQILLGRLLGDDLGFRAALVPVLVGTPLAVLALVRRLGRDRWVAFAAFALLLEGNLTWGFVSHAAAMPLCLGGAALAIGFLVEGGAARAIALVAISVALALTHAQVTALWGASAGVLAASAWLAGRASLRRAGWLVATLVPGQALLAAYMAASGWATGKGVTVEGAGEVGARWIAPWTLLRELPWTTGLAITGWGAPLVYAVALAALGLGALAQRRERDVSAPAASSWPAAGLVLWALWLAVYLAAPARWHTVAIAGRFAPAVALATLWLVPLRAPGSPAGASSLRAARLALVGVAATALLLAHDVFARYDRSLAPLARVIDAIPRGSRVTTLAYQPFPDGIRLPMYAHVGGYVHAARGGLAASSFTGTGVTYRDEVPRRLRLGDDVLAPWRSGWVLDDAMAAYWDYVVVMRGPRYPGRPLAPGVGRGERVLVDGEFELWRLGH